MSVVASKKNETEFKIGHDAVKFAEHTRKICNNRKIFSSRHLDLATNVKNMATRVVALVYEANSKQLNDPKRKEMQNSALDTLSGLHGLMQLAHETCRGERGVRLITGGKLKYWASLISELKTKIKNWMKSDEERSKEEKK